MIVGLAAYLDQEIERLLPGIGRASTRLKEYFADKSYGDDIESLFIGLILTGPDSERLHPVRPLEYRKKFTLKSSLTGSTEYLGNTVEFDIKPDYATVRIMNSENAQKYIIDALIDGLDVLKENQHKFPKFDVARFTTEFTDCLQN
jgi:hypothetical protein